MEVTQTAIGLYDERQKVDVSLFKALETDNLFGLGMNEELVLRNRDNGLAAVNGKRHRLAGKYIPVRCRYLVKRVEKCDAETGNIIPMTGTGFQIKDLSKPGGSYNGRKGAFWRKQSRLHRW